MSTEQPSSSGDADPDALYDAYLDACLAGRAEEPAEFCARHGLTAPELRARFDSLHAIARRARPHTPSPASDAAPDVPFERLGEFRLLRALDRGGMGAVYLARQESLGRDVAIKLIRPELSGSPEAAERFRREARALARLRHPNIVTVHAVGEDRGVQFIAMELVPGRSLDEIVSEAASRGATVPVSKAIGWCRELAGALQFAHDQGVVHRDVKPSNVRITPDGRPVLIDFGIAKDTAGGDAQLTHTFAGSPVYAAPEQLAGAPADQRVDVYGLGVVLYQCLTGRVPFAGGSMEEVLSRVLVEEALPPRRLNPSVSRDVETVVLHALEKDPERRYATAAAFASDLDAVLASRPISVRPPGPVDRLRKWSRRRPVPAAVAATLVVGALVAASVLVAQDRVAAADRRARAAEKVGAARDGLAAYRTARESALTLDREAVDLRSWLTNRHLTAAEDAARDAKEDAAAAARRARETRFFEILDLLRAAELLDPATPGTEELRAGLFRERWLDARAVRDAEATAFYRDLVAQHDASGRFTRELRGTASVSIRTQPPGAQVYLFAEREQSDVAPGGEHRLVPAPRDGSAWPFAPGTPSLRVVSGAGRVRTDDVIVAVAGRPVATAFLVTRDAGDVHRLDRLVSADGADVLSRSDLRDAARLDGGEYAFVFERDARQFTVRAASLAGAGIEVSDAEDMATAGGVTATVIHRGEATDLVLPRGLVLRRTDAPVAVSPASAAGTTPVEGLELPEGQYLALIESPGRPLVRFPFQVDVAGSAVFNVRLPSAGPPAEGFVFVARGDADDAGFWLMEREVTSEEYLEFLNDPRVLTRIAAAPEPILFPRTPDNRRDGGSWTRAADGRFSLPAAWNPSWPVLGVSWLDAREYAAWRTARSASPSSRAEYRLPTFPEWVLAAGGGVGRTYSFGDRFHARWVKSCFARPHASPEPVRSYPIDELPYGIFDMTGSAYEWVDGWWDESRGQRRLAGGSWAQGEIGRFNTWGGTGAEPQAVSEEYGFRLAVSVAEERR